MIENKAAVLQTVLIAAFVVYAIYCNMSVPTQSVRGHSASAQSKQNPGRHGNLDEMAAVRKTSPHGEFTLFYGGSEFCNFCPCRFKATAIDGYVHEFNNSEQYFMYNKALTFNDKEIAAKMLAEKDPGQVKAYGRQVRRFDDKIWNRVSNGIMDDALRAKFGQNPKLREALLKTEGSQLVECSPTDQIWGIGLPIDSPDCVNPLTWRGANRLGKSLDRVREEILAAERSH